MTKAKVTPKSIYKRLALIVFVIFSFVISISVWLSQDRVEINWTPEGEWILYSCGYFGNDLSISHLYITRPDGSELQRISTDRFVATSPSWSPNGDWIAFINGTYGQDIYVMRPDGSEFHKLAEFDNLYRITSLAWSPNSDWIAFGLDKGVFDTQTDIRMINAKTQETKTLYQTPDYIQFLRWSLDGQYLAFVSPAGQSTSGIHLLNIETGITDWVYHRVGIIMDIGWSADGDALWVTLIDAGSTNLWKFTLHDKSLQRFDAEPFYSSPEESPNGQYIAFYGFDETGNHIYIMSTNGDNLHPIFEKPLSVPTCSSLDWYDFQQ